ncbi:MAG: hypothetical protein ABI885_08850 [Gammaproteobacteria bacterium]
MSLRQLAAFALSSALFAVVLSGPLRADTAPVAVPDTSSIYEYIRSHIDPASGALSADAMTLPDEPAARRFSRLRWVPGSLEGLGTRHMHWDGSEKASRATRLIELIAAGNVAAEPVLYELLRTDDVVTFYSGTLDLASAMVRDVEPELHDMARRLATTSHDRGPVKFAIAMLGSIADERDLAIVQTLALHDEFGLYAAQAIAEMAPDRQAALFDMARKVTGWGRIEAVAEMVATSNPDLRRWLLTEGFRNTVNPQYLAYQCSTIANLAGALADSPPGAKADLPLLTGAADLIQALIKPGPAPGFDNYSDAAAASQSFLRLVQKRRDSVSFFLAASALQDYAATRADASADANSTAVKWQPEEQREVASLAANVVDDSSWRRRVVAAVSEDDANLDQAAAAAQKLKVDTFELHLKRLARNPANPRRWALAFAGADSTKAARLVVVAQKAFGAKGKTRADGALEAVLQGVSAYPGAGLSIVEASLADEDEGVRRAAVETLVRWGGPYLRDATVRTALNEAARGEEDEALKARMVALLNLGSLP